MLLCSILRGALSASFGTVVQIAIFLLQNSNITRVLASMPPGAEDEVIVIEHLPGRRVHLQDFFWTGLEDAPPWVDPSQGLTYYETRTIVHTVTVYTPTDEKDPISSHRPDTYNPECVTCIEPTPRLDDDQSIGILIGDDPGQRYWLVTVLRPGEDVPPKVELRLARLYRTAFSRQQQWHLGLPMDPRSRRDALLRDFINRKNIQKHFETSSQVKVPQEKISANTTEIQSFELTVGTSESSTTHARTETSVGNLVDEKYFSNVSQVKSMRMIEIPRPKKMLLQVFDIDATNDYDKSTKDDFALKKIIKTLKEETKSFSTQNDESITVDPTHLVPDTIDDSSKQFPPQSMPIPSSDSKLNTESISKSRSNDNEDANTSVRSRFRLADGSIPGVVKVRMHKFEKNASVFEGAMRLIYSVHLDDKPVPAEKAAKDMALLSPQEVALELGAPVIVQSEPYLKESIPQALSRRRDAWLLIGAAGAGVVLLIFVLVGLILLTAKRKRAHSAAVAPPNKSILKKEREYATATSGLDNIAFSTSETEIKTEGTSQRQTPRTLSRTPITPDTPDSLELGIHEVSSDDDEEPKKTRGSVLWSTQKHAAKKARASHGKMMRADAMDRAESPDSLTDHIETLESLENGYAKHKEESTTSPRSYLSMPSCKQFPSMRSVEPLSRVLEPVMIRHLDIDSPELVRHHRNDNIDDTFLTRTSSASKDPGAVGPIVWNLRKQIFSTEGNGTSETDVDGVYHLPSGPVGRARRRLHDLLEDSFSLFGSRDVKIKEPQRPSQPITVARTADTLAILSETRGKSAHVSPVTTPTMEMKTRPRTSLPRRGLGEDIPETGQIESIHSRGAWGSRPLSAGPFHRPNLPEVDTRRILADSRLLPEDPAVPLIASIKKELEKFSSQ
ncbi:hypothetical protein ALC56_11157 [Trachymyrmex septentrionalis]|uniref:Uncharacterized protein n=1 Tax=Trachymyrmex septentrionalis TaxID=34720 RepID=A0A195F2I3_9HYME|nr:PREDICTED: uncharacterized protein LOC108752679 [Trachymyrmex septentrionalis]KYN34668.1 hypothetical protein ALC56_11157 [Trachymyrmex septentrionalis]